MLFIFFSSHAWAVKLLYCSVVWLIFLIGIAFSSWFAASFFYLLSDMGGWFVGSLWDMIFPISCATWPIVASYWYVCLVKISLINFCLLTLLFRWRLSSLVFVYYTLIKGWSVWDLGRFSLISPSYIHLLLWCFINTNKFESFWNLFRLIVCLYLSGIAQIFLRCLFNFIFGVWIVVDVWW